MITMVIYWQKECFELRYNQDLSLGEIGNELGISRQGVFDNLSRTEALLINMEKKTGCVQRDMRCRKAAHSILDVAQELMQYADKGVAEKASLIVQTIQGLEE